MRFLLILLLWGCPGETVLPDGGAPVDGGLDAATDTGVDRDAGEDAGGTDDGGDAGSTDVPPGDAGDPDRVSVLVTLDGVPTADVRVTQGGTEQFWLTGPDGRADVHLDRSVVGELVLIASHPEARLAAQYAGFGTSVTIELERFDRTDNTAYPFQDPGEPERRPNTGQCAHCHQTINEDWFGSAHRTSATNTHVRDLYADAKAADPTGFGGCADCHAPGMNGQLVGRDLDQATDLALDYGVHCDVCHRVEEVNVGGAPAFGGWLRAQRPIEEGHPALGAGGFLPLTFGPSHDTPNVRMGSVQRDFFRSAELCGGCHQLTQPTDDLVRWPSGQFPAHTTFDEWQAGPLSGVAPCQACHMPPDPQVANGGDLQLFNAGIVGIAGGWFRPPGSVRSHAFVGPRTEGAGLLELAAGLFVERSVQGGILTATVTVQNVGAGHAIPTGETMRSLILTVDAECAQVPLVAVDGDSVPSFGGFVTRKSSSEDWGAWPDAQVGDVIRVVNIGAFRDYAGVGPFGDGTFDAAAKGLPEERVVGARTVQSVSPLVLDAPLPPGDRAYLTRSVASAGRSGFAFARVTVDQSGTELVPHFAATDVTIDNRLMPQRRFSTRHLFSSSCPDPVVTARLFWRRFPLREARDRGWDPGDRLMVEVRR